MERYSTIAEVAREYRVSDEHVRRMCVSGRWPAVRVGAAWRIPTAELQAFLTKGQPSGDQAEARQAVCEL